MSTMADTPKRRPRRKFSEEFKEQAARLVLDEGQSMAAVAREIRDEQLTIRFEIDGYAGPPYRLEHPLSIDAAVLDADGATLAVTLSTAKTDDSLNFR